MANAVVPAPVRSGPKCRLHKVDRLQEDNEVVKYQQWRISQACYFLFMGGCFFFCSLVTLWQWSDSLIYSFEPKVCSSSSSSSNNSNIGKTLSNATHGNKSDSIITPTLSNSTDGNGSVVPTPGVENGVGLAQVMVLIQMLMMIVLIVVMSTARRTRCLVCQIFLLLLAYIYSALSGVNMLVCSQQWPLLLEGLICPLSTLTSIGVACFFFSGILFLIASFSILIIAINAYLNLPASGGRGGVRWCPLRCRRADYAEFP
ncbi:uncharacterized protein LOC143291931 [Babylonia areolata]|uniref:uncharacterized protein LOC143291931 n=1 Tax=Babylonia areolata TaxID=304850 RepID=UPI003FD5EDD5